MCATTGALEHARARDVDVFASEPDATRALTSRGLCKTTTRADACLGVVAVGDAVLLLLARKTKVAATLPNGHEVMSVQEARWHRAALRNPARASTREERANVASMTEATMDNLYYYCETFDATRAFAHACRNAASTSVTPTKEPPPPDPEWVWNAWLAKPLNDLCIPRACPALLQGLAESRALIDAVGAPWRVAVFGRRSRAHPGTRYIARGLNADAAPGNEVEMEQIAWREEEEEEEEKGGPETKGNDASASAGGGVIGGETNQNQTPKKTARARWSAYVWRRGSVPIRWGQEIKQSIGDAEITVAADDPYAGTATYFRKLVETARPPASAVGGDGGGGAAEPASPPFPVTCVNLLRCAPGKPEMVLSEHFHEAVRGVRKGTNPDSRASPPTPSSAALAVVNFDWHGNMKALGEQKTVEGLWSCLRSYMVDAGVSHGVCGRGDGDGGGGDGRRGSGSESRVDRWQLGMLRYNCADSLDRTNLASYFAAIQALIEQCRVVGLDIGGFGAAAARAREAPPLLPPGWESRLDTVTGRTFYIDHNTKTTSWKFPEPEEATAADGSPRSNSPAQPGAEGESDGAASSSGRGDRAAADEDAWTLLRADVDELRARMPPTTLAAMCDIFLANGDLHAGVYTASRAIHTAIFHLLDGSSTSGKNKGERSGSSMASLSNLSISAQRRFLNMTQDATRHAQFEMLLGLNLARHFPSRVGGGASATVRSRPPRAVVTRAPPHAGDAPVAPVNALVGASAAFASTPLWVCPGGVATATLALKLDEAASTPTHALFTSPPATAEHLVPAFVDVLAGQSMRALRPVGVNLAIPRSPPGTPLLFPLISGSGRGGGGGGEFEDAVRLLPIRPRSRGARRSLRTFPGATLHPRFPFNV